MPKSFNEDNAGDNGENQGDNQQGSFDSNGSPSNDNGQPNQNSNGKTQAIDVGTLQKRVNDSQQFIETLKSERAKDREELEALRAELAKRPSIDEVMEHINRQAGNKDNIDPNDLINKSVEAIESRLTAKEAENQRKANIKAVSDSLKAALGSDNLDSKVAKIAAENDMSFDDVFDLAERNPKAALKLLGVKTNQRSSSNGHNGDINTQALYNNSGNNQNQQKTTIMDKRSDRDRVDYMNQRMNERLSQMNQ